MLGRKECHYCGESMPHADLVCWGCSQDRFRELLKQTEAREPTPGRSTKRPTTALNAERPLFNGTAAAIPRWLAATGLAVLALLGGYWLGKTAAPLAEEPRAKPIFTGSTLRASLPPERSASNYPSFALR